MYPRGWFESARYLRENAAPGDIVQDSRNDPYAVLSDRSEHPAYAIDYRFGNPNPILQARLEELEETARLWLATTPRPLPLTAAQIQELRAAFGARW